MFRIKLLNALYAGLFAAGGSFFGKLTGDYFQKFTLINSFAILSKNVWIIQSICLGLMIFCNILNWRYFVKSLHSSDQTLTATVLCSASNYCFSFLFGFVIFGERITSISIIGMFLILLGLVCLCKDVVKYENRKIK